MSEAIVKDPEEMSKDDDVGFIVDNDQKAEWCLEKIKEAAEDKAIWKKFYAERYKAVEESADATIQRMEAMLMSYFQTVPHKKTATQENYVLPSGKLVMKKQEPTYDRKDDEVIKWLRANGGGDYVKVKEEVDWSGLKKTLTVVGDKMATQDGEIIPGITVNQREDIFKVEVK